jgi:type II secretory pathway component PulK
MRAMRQVTEAYGTVNQLGYIKWADIGMALVAVLLFVALLVMVSGH